MKIRLSLGGGIVTEPVDVPGKIMYARIYRIAVLPVAHVVRAMIFGEENTLPTSNVTKKISFEWRGKQYDGQPLFELSSID